MPLAARRVRIARLIPINHADTLPTPLTHRRPVFSDRAKQLGLSGTVVMNVLVNERGTVDQVVLVTGVPGADVDDTAMSAAKGWTYRPATKNGIPGEGLEVGASRRHTLGSLSVLAWATSSG
jgi:TonB family protein